MKNSHPKMRRRRYLVNRRLQLGLAFRFLILLILFALFMGFESYMVFWPVVSEYIPEAQLSTAIRLVTMRLAYFALPIGFVIFAVVVVLAHRIAGPLYRIQNTLDRLIHEKDASPIRLRKHDELKGLTERINRIIPLLSESRDTPATELGPNPEPRDRGNPSPSGRSGDSPNRGST
jgi:hypothetical protein